MALEYPKDYNDRAASASRGGDALNRLALEIAWKIIERHRRYIIAATEILDGDFPRLSEYMDYIRRERAL